MWVRKYVLLIQKPSLTLYHVSVCKFEIRPTIVLPIEINNEDKTPNLEKIIKFTDDLLEKVKIEIDYKKDESK